MGDIGITGARIRAGRWEAAIAMPSPTAPDIEILHQEKPLPDLVIGEAGPDGNWPVSVAIPSGLLSDGVQTFVIRDKRSDARLGHFTIVTGVPLEDDIRAELDLLRAELDMLKKAFRRHCLETGNQGG